jgi:hypothetical protein
VWAYSASEGADGLPGNGRHRGSGDPHLDSRGVRAARAAARYRYTTFPTTGENWQAEQVTGYDVHGITVTRSGAASISMWAGLVPQRRSLTRGKSLREDEADDGPSALPRG